MKIWQVALALTLLTHVPFWGFAFLNVDEAAHYVGASELVGPGALYATFADNKPPLVYWAPSGEHGIPDAAGTRPASRFVVPIDTVSGYLSGSDAFERGELDTRHRILPQHRRLSMGDLTEREPSHIVDTSAGGLAFWSRFPLSSFPELEAFVAAHYRP